MDPSANWRVLPWAYVNHSTHDLRVFCLLLSKDVPALHAMRLVFFLWFGVGLSSGVNWNRILALVKTDKLTSCCFYVLTTNAHPVLPTNSFRPEFPLFKALQSCKTLLPRLRAHCMMPPRMAAFRDFRTFALTFRFFIDTVHISFAAGLSPFLNPDSKSI